MMRVINRFKRIIAGILSVIIMITVISDITVYAEEFRNHEKAQIDSQTEEEIQKESEYDMNYGNNGRDWKIAIYVDLLSWNSFHNAVQQH